MSHVVVTVDCSFAQYQERVKLEEQRALELKTSNSGGSGILVYLILKFEKLNHCLEGVRGRVDLELFT